MPSTLGLESSYRQAILDLMHVYYATYSIAAMDEWIIDMDTQSIRFFHVVLIV